VSIIRFPKRASQLQLLLADDADREDRLVRGTSPTCIPFTSVVTLFISIARRQAELLQGWLFLSGRPAIGAPTVAARPSNASVNAFDRTA